MQVKVFKCTKEDCRDIGQEFSESDYKLHVGYKLHTEGSKKKLRSRIKKNP